MPADNEKYLSGVTGRFQLEGADSMQATLQITMNLGTWKQVHEVLAKDDRYGSWQLKSASATAYARIEKDA